MKRGRELLVLLALVLGALVSTYFALQAYANLWIAKKLESKLSKLPFPTAYGSVSYNLLENDLTINGFLVGDRPFAFIVEQVRIDLPPALIFKDFPESFKLELRNFFIPSNLPYISELLKGFGYSSRFVSGSLLSGYSFKEGSLVGELLLNLNGIAQLDVNFELQGVSRELLKELLQGRISPSAVVQRASLKFAALKFRDRGLVESFISSLAKQEGMAKERVKAELLKTVASSFKKNRDFAERLGVPLALFIDNPKCLEVKVEPPEPVPLVSLMKDVSRRPRVKALLRKLNVSAFLCN